MLNLENCDFGKKVPQFLLYDIFSALLLLNLGMFQLLSTYEINLKLGNIYVDDMLKFSRKSKNSNMLSWNFECYKSQF